MSGRFEHSDKHTLSSKPADNADNSVTRMRRIELITGTGRRRRWSADDKARIVVESLKPDASVSEVARRHGLSPQQLFGWRRQARHAVGSAPAGRGSLEPSRCAPATSGRVNLRGSPGPEPAFAPVVLASATSSSTPAAPLSPAIDTAMGGLIEIAIGDLTVRVRGQIETGLLMAVLRAVRRAS
jgi:transposase